MKNTIAIAALMMLLGAGCAPAPVSKPTETEQATTSANPLPADAPSELDLMPAVEYGKPILILDGEAAVFSDGLQVTLMNIDDSRCPADVQCVWAGELSPVLSVMLLDMPEPPAEVRLGTTTKKEAKALGRTFILNAASEDSVTITVTK